MNGRPPVGRWALVALISMAATFLINYLLLPGALVANIIVGAVVGGTVGVNMGLWDRRARRRDIEASRPLGVRIVREDGTELPVDLVYLGTDKAGLRRWLIANATVRPGDAITAERLRPRTTIVCHMIREMMEP